MPVLTILDFSSMMFSEIGGEPIEQKVIQRNIVADAPIPHTEVRKTAEPTGSYKNLPRRGYVKSQARYLVGTKKQPPRYTTC